MNEDTDDEREERIVRKICSKCGETFSCGTLLSRHKKLRANPHKFRCRICCASFKIKINLKKHMNERHSEVTDTVKKKKNPDPEEGLQASVIRIAPPMDKTDGELSSKLLEVVEKRQVRDAPPGPKRARVVSSGDEEGGENENNLEDREDEDELNEVNEINATPVSQCSESSQHPTEPHNFEEISTRPTNCSRGDKQWMTQLCSRLAGAQDAKQINIPIVDLFKWWGIPIPIGYENSFPTEVDVGFNTAVDFMRGAITAKTAAEMKAIINTKPEITVGDGGLALLTAELLSGLPVIEAVEFSRLLPDIVLSPVLENFFRILLLMKLTRGASELRNDLSLLKLLPKSIMSKVRFGMLESMKDASNNAHLDLLSSSEMEEMEELVQNLAWKQEELFGSCQLFWRCIAFEYLRSFSLPHSPTVFQIMGRLTANMKEQTIAVAKLQTGNRIVDLHLHNFIIETWEFRFKGDGLCKVEATFADNKAFYDRLYMGTFSSKMTIGLARIYVALESPKVIELLIGNQRIVDVLTTENLHVFVFVFIRKVDVKGVGELTEAIFEKFSTFQIAEALSRLSEEDGRIFFGLDNFRNDQTRLYELMKSWAYSSCRRMQPQSDMNEEVPDEVRRKFESVRDNLNLQTLLSNARKLLNDGVIPEEDIFGFIFE